MFQTEQVYTFTVIVFSDPCSYIKVTAVVERWNEKTEYFVHLAGSYLVQFKHCYMYGHDYELKAFDQNFFFFFFLGGCNYCMRNNWCILVSLKKKWCWHFLSYHLRDIVETLLSSLHSYWFWWHWPIFMLEFFKLFWLIQVSVILHLWPYFAWWRHFDVIHSFL